MQRHANGGIRARTSRPDFTPGLHGRRNRRRGTQKTGPQIRPGTHIRQRFSHSEERQCGHRHDGPPKRAPLFRGHQSGKGLRAFQPAKKSEPQAAPDLNAGNILKPALSRGEIQVIGATTFTEYRKYIEKDQALERRFQPVRVEEPSVADTLAVMNGIKHYYEQHHHVQVPADVLSATVTLSERYITDRYLPDKAIDLLDEACACCNLAHPVISEYLGMQKELDALKQEEAEMENADVNEPIDYERVAERKTRVAQLEIHSLLEALQPHFSDVPILVMYPGEFDGRHVKLFNRLQPNDYYRAFNVV